MLRLALLVLALAFAVLGGPADAAAASAETACCPCDDESDDDGCCSALHCPCVPHLAADVTPAEALLASPIGVSHPAAWLLLAEDRARDRRSAPPTRPPIG
jgi:hypothetical protein